MSSSQGPLLALAVPTIAAFFGYFWIKRKRAGSKSDPGDISQTSSTDTTDQSATTSDGIPTSSTSSSSSQFRPFARSLSGVESAPIDIIIPPKLRASKSNPVVISDEDLDQEIEKANSMRYGHSFDASKKNNSTEILVEKKKMSPPIMAALVVEETFSVEPTQNQEENTVEDKEIILDSNEVQNQNNERDSANHSPVDVMLASSSVCSISDNHSERSSDSGKGGSNVTTSPTPKDISVESSSNIIIYEFLIPQSLVGKLIGKQGSSVAGIKTKSGAHVIIRKHPDTSSKFKVCMVEGTQKEVDHALKIIRDKFPVKRFPEITLEQVIFAPEFIPMPIVPESLRLIESITNDTRISCVSTPNHLFLHQPIHPTFPDLQVLSNFINANYNSSESPLLPTPVAAGSVCVASAGNIWYRVSVEEIDEETGIYLVKFLDYGGRASVEYTQLRQIREDFLTLPFQAAECMLANIETTEENGTWLDAAYAAVYELIKDQNPVLTNVIDYKENIAYVNCYVVLGPTEVVFLNDELVKRGFARWTNEEAQAAGAIIASS